MDDELKHFLTIQINFINAIFQDVGEIFFD